MYILLDSNISLSKQLFEPLGACHGFSSRQPSLEAVQHADVLIVRSTTQVDKVLLQQAHKLKFVGTATIGIDHLDIIELEERNIEWHSAAGCNAQAVLEYVILTLLSWFKGQMACFSGCKVAVIGYGNIGSKLVQALSFLGSEVLVVDPFVEHRLKKANKKNYSSVLPKNARWASMQDTWEANIVSLHTPLTSAAHSECPTYHLINETYLEQFTGELIINTCRGAVIDNQALDSYLHQQREGTAYKHKPHLEVVLDVWESEPTPIISLIEKAWQATPHIAGYTLEGKARGSYMMYQALCESINQDCQVQLSQLLPDANLSKSVMDKSQISERLHFTDLLQAFYPIDKDDAAMRNLIKLPQDERGDYFDGLRKNYALRREHSAYLPQLELIAETLSGEDAESLQKLMRSLGSTSFLNSSTQESSL